MTEIEYTLFPKPLIAPDINYGWAVINALIAFSTALKPSRKDTIRTRKSLFIEIFGREFGHRAFEEFEFEKLAGFYLNLDIRNQLALLAFLLSIRKEVDLNLPKIQEWEKIGQKYYGSDQKFTEDDVRMLAPGFKDLSHWDCFPHAMVWVDRFMLYVNNNGLRDNGCSGRKYGNFTNWATYWNQLDIISQQKLIAKLVHYA